MAMTLFEASKRMDGEVKRATIIEMFARNSDLLRVMSFENMTGDAISYNVESKLPSVGFRGINEAYAESVGIVNPEVERLRILGGDLDVDKALIKTRGPDIRAQEEMFKVKAMSLYLTDIMINGDSVVDPRQFDGLRKRVTGPALFSANLGAPLANSPLSLEALDAAIDQVDGANAIMVSKAMKRKLNKASRLNIGGYILSAKDEFGFTIMQYNELPIIVVDYNHLGARIIDFNEVGPAGGVTSTSVYVANIGDGYVTGLQNGDMEVQDLGQLNAKPVYRTRIEWLVGLAAMHYRALARVWGITNADVTA
jgi:hypothetical protein